MDLENISASERSQSQKVSSCATHLWETGKPIGTTDKWLSGAEGGETGNHCLMYVGFSSRVMKIFWNWGQLYHLGNIPNATEPHTFKMVNFMSCEFYLNFEER